MKSTRTRVAVAVIVAVALIAAVVAIASSGGSSTSATRTAGRGPGVTAPEATGPISVAAAYLGIPRAKLRGELRSGRTLAQVAGSISGRSVAGLTAALLAAGRARLEAEAAAGHISSAERNVRLARLQRRVTAVVNRSLRGRAALRARSDLAAAASYLGIKRAELQKELHSGRTLSQVAAATPGHTSAGLIDALVAARRSKLAAELSAGTITATQEQATLKTLRSRVTAAVNRVRQTGSAQPGAEEGAGGEAGSGAEAPEPSPEAAQG